MRLTESTKITLTIGQIRRLVYEANEASRNASPTQQTNVNKLTRDDLAAAVKILDNAQKNGTGIQLNDTARGMITSEIVKHSNGKINETQAKQLTETTAQIVGNPRFAQIARKMLRAGGRSNPFGRGAIAGFEIVKSKFKNIRTLRRSGMSLVQAVRHTFRDTFNDRRQLFKEFIGKYKKIEPFEKEFIKNCLFNSQFWMSVLKMIVAVFASKDNVDSKALSSSCLEIGNIVANAATVADSSTAAAEQKKVAESTRRLRKRMPRR